MKYLPGIKTHRQVVVSPEMLKQLNRYRNELNQTVSGYVVRYDCEMAGWTLLLDNPRSWMPGCEAFDIDGRLWRAVGGNASDGAERWEPVYKTV